MVGQLLRLHPRQSRLLRHDRTPVRGLSTSRLRVCDEELKICVRDGNDHVLLGRRFLWPWCQVHLMPQDETLEQFSAKQGFCQMLDLRFMFSHAFFDEISYIILQVNDSEIELTG